MYNAFSVRYRRILDLYATTIINIELHYADDASNNLLGRDLLRSMVGAIQLFGAMCLLVGQEKG